MAKEKVRITETQLKGIIKESIQEVLDMPSIKESANIEDYFDIQSLSKSTILSIATDLRVYIQAQGYGSNLTDEGEPILREDTVAPLPVAQLRTELQKLGFKKWQVKSYVSYNKVRLVILYADIAQNTKIIENEMLTHGWVRAIVSPHTIVHGITLRMMIFDPASQPPITKEARRYQYLYHWTPYGNLQSILQGGIEARNENDFLSYDPKAHLMKGDIPKAAAAKLGWMLYNKNIKLKNGKYALIRITMKNVPNNIDFYGDGHFPYGYFCLETIPPSALDLFGEITYNDKYNYNNEQIKVLSNNDTMM